MKVKSLIGKRFGRLTVLDIAGKDNQKKYFWLCKCDCGNIKKIRGSSLNFGSTKSCGCLWKEALLENGKKGTHHMTNTQEYNIWAIMKQRCLNKNNPKYKNYGGRGIKVCEEWLKFDNFYKDMGERPEGKSIDRIDNEKGYFKENCRWATLKQQGRNKRNNRIITYKGKTMCLPEWAEALKITYSSLEHRLNRGWNLERALKKY